jgi:hypothetical protein
LGEDDLVLAKFKYGLPLAHFGEKRLGIECSLIGIFVRARVSKELAIQPASLASPLPLRAAV